jgi:hypothetical protein
MIIDEEILKNGMTEIILAKLIARHALEQERFEKLYNYYIGKHAICERKRSSDKIANNKIVCNHAKYIVDIAKSYLVGNPVTYTCSDGYDIEAVKNSFSVQDMASIDSELEKTMSIYGKAYELVYADEKSQPKSVCRRQTHLSSMAAVSAKYRCAAYIIIKSVILKAASQEHAVLSATVRIFTHTKTSRTALSI